MKIVIIELVNRFITNQVYYEFLFNTASIMCI
jgi:hypothetical protein